MRFNIYKLQKAVTTTDEIGQDIESWLDVEDIEVSISNKMFSNIEGDILYRRYTPSGITTYKKFDLKTKYRLYSVSHTYKIESFVLESRLTQLQLKECVLND